ncbi:MAG: hypothetical protein WBV23_03905 [Desulfobaccales bacterium]
MLKNVEKACSWAVSQVEAGIDWVRDNWPAITAKAEEMIRRAYEVAMTQIRQIVVAFERGLVIGIETVERRQSMPFDQALAEAKSVVKAMTDEQVCAYTAHWFCQEPDRAIAV